MVSFIIGEDQMHRIEESGKVKFPQAFKDFWEGMFSFGGRSTRAGYWWGQFSWLLISLILLLVVYVTYEVAFIMSSPALIMMGITITIIGAIVIYIANTAVLFRRLRDVGIKTPALIIWLVLTWLCNGIIPWIRISGWTVFASFISSLMTIIQLIVCCLPPDKITVNKEN